MRSLSRRGFTLVELIIAIALGAVVMTAMYRAIVGTQRVTQGGMQRIDVQQNLRAGITYLGSALRELDAEENDIFSATPMRLRFRDPRWVAALCAPPGAGGGGVVLTVRQRTIYGVSTPDPAVDSVLVFRDGNRGSRNDDTWLVGSLLKVRGSNCTNGDPAAQLTVEISAASGGSGAVGTGVTQGAPIRAFHAAEVSLFQDANGRWWMGHRQADRLGVWTPVRALAGPLTGAGLAFTYFDSTGVATGVVTEIASVGVAMRAESWARVRSQAGSIDYARDSLFTRVALRNNPRF
jgi:prepilin-type N-terminal cleavage/methylation domain-containing protein